MIDKKYAERLSASILGNTLKTFPSGHYGIGFHDNFIRDFEEERNGLLGEVIGKFWDQLMTSCNAYGPGGPLLVSEKALACLVRRGVDHRHLRMKGTNARVELPHLTYYVDKEGAGCSAGPCVHSNWGHLPLRWIVLSGEGFADFMFEFDELVGSMIEKVDEALLEYKVQAMQYEIICQTLGQLGEQFLKPHGIRWEVGTHFTEKTVPVTFSDRTHMPITETIATDSLTDVFMGIPERMAAQKEIRIRRNRRFPFDDDDDLGSIFP